MEVRKEDIVSSLLAMDCEEALHAIFLSLDGSSLSACSLVCKSWRNFIQQRVWRCPRVRPVLEAKLRQQWRLSKPTILDRQIEGETQGFDIVCDDELTLVGMKDGHVKVIRNERPTRNEGGPRGEEECSTVFTLDCRTSTGQQSTSTKYAFQYWLGPDVIVTVGNGLVQCWNRLTGTKEYENAHHERGSHADIFGVTVLRSGMVATGADGGEVVVLHKEQNWCEWLLTGKDEGPIWSVKARLVTEDRGQVNHMHTDPGCNHTAIGTGRAITLWDLEEGRVVEGSKRVSPRYINMLVYIQPHVFVLKGQVGAGVEVWNMMTGDLVKHIDIDVRQKGIGTNGSEVILSTAYCCPECATDPDAKSWSNYILVFNAAELSDPNVPAENVRWRELLHREQVGDTNIVEAAINKTGIVAVFPKQEKEGKESATMIKTFEFWRAECATEKEEDERNSLAKVNDERRKNLEQRWQEASTEKNKQRKRRFFRFF